jgi:hypothetical protein
MLLPVPSGYRRNHRSSGATQRVEVEGPEKPAASYAVVRAYYFGFEVIAAAVGIAGNS